MNIYVHKDGVQYGPYTLDQLQGYLNAGSFTLEDLACYDSQNWIAIAQVPGITQPPVLAVQQPSQVTNRKVQKKNSQNQPVEQKKEESGCLTALGGLIIIPIFLGSIIYEHREKIADFLSSDDGTEQISQNEVPVEENAPDEKEEEEDPVNLESSENSEVDEKEKAVLLIKQQAMNEHLLKVKVADYFEKKFKLFYQNCKNRTAKLRMNFDKTEISKPNELIYLLRSVDELPADAFILYNSWLKVIVEEDKELQESLLTQFDLEAKSFQSELKREFYPNIVKTFVKLSGEEFDEWDLRTGNLRNAIFEFDLSKVDNERGGAIYFLNDFCKLIPHSLLDDFVISYSKSKANDNRTYRQKYLDSLKEKRDWTLYDCHKFFKDLDSGLYNLCDEIVDYHFKGIIPKAVAPKE